MHLRARSGAGTVAEANSGGGGQERAGGTVPATQTTTAPGPPASRTQSPAHGGGGWIASAALVALALLLLLALPAALVLAALRRPIVPIVGLPVLGHPTLPKLSWPALRRPTLPKLSLPAVRRPSLPKLSLPAVRRATLPKVVLPALRRPTLPKLSLPTMPAVRRPTLPKVAMPAIPRPTLPKPALPTLPALRRPTFPKIALPAIRRPKPPALALALRRSKSPKQRRPSVPARRSGAGGPVPQPRAVAPPDRVPTIGYVRYADRAELERHTNAMRQACATRNWKLAGVLRDEQRSGSKALERPGLVQALERMSTPGRTRLVVSKLSHLSRSATDLMALFEWFARHDVELVAVDAGLDMTTPDGRRAAHALLATVARRQEQARNGARNGTVPATQVVAAGRARERGDHG
jgi:hypothetical protein